MKDTEKVKLTPKEVEKLKKQKNKSLRNHDKINKDEKD